MKPIHNHKTPNFFRYLGWHAQAFGASIFRKGNAAKTKSYLRSTVFTGTTGGLSYYVLANAAFLSFVSTAVMNPVGWALGGLALIGFYRTYQNYKDLYNSKIGAALIKKREDHWLDVKRGYAPTFGKKVKAFFTKSGSALGWLTTGAALIAGVAGGLELAGIAVAGQAALLTAGMTALGIAGFATPLAVTIGAAAAVLIAPVFALRCKSATARLLAVKEKSVSLSAPEEKAAGFIRKALSKLFGGVSKKKDAEPSSPTTSSGYKIGDYSR